MRGQSFWIWPMRGLGLASPSQWEAWAWLPPACRGVEQTKLWWSGAKTDITSDWWDYYLALIAPWVRAINTEQPNCGQSKDLPTIPRPMRGRSREWECDQGLERGFIATEKGVKEGRAGSRNGIWLQNYFIWIKQRFWCTSNIHDISSLFHHPSTLYWILYIFLSNSKLFVFDETWEKIMLCI